MSRLLGAVTLTSTGAVLMCGRCYLLMCAHYGGRREAERAIRAELGL